MTEFISKWNIMRPCTLALPLIELGTYDFYVDWGDGSESEHITSHKGSHEYKSPGDYIITCTGTIKGLRVIDSKDCYYLLDILQWGSLKLGNEGSYFKDCKRLQISAKDAPDLSETTTLKDMFFNCQVFNSPIDHWDVSTITNMEHMFNYAYRFNQPLRSWNVSNVVNMRGLFAYTAFNQDISTWDVSNVIDISNLFFCARTFNQPLNSWNVSNVCNMRRVFSYAISFNQPLNSWDVSNVTRMSHMFGNAVSFNQDISMWNVSNVTQMGSMFSQAYDFNQDISTWDVSNVDYMGYMLYMASNFDTTNRKLLSKWNIKSYEVVANIGGMGKGLFLTLPNPILTWSEFKTDSYPYSESDCAICMSEIADKEDWCAFKCNSTMKLGIPHCYHKECIESWVSKHLTCPSCRGGISIIAMSEIEEN